MDNKDFEYLKFMNGTIDIDETFILWQHHRKHIVNIIEKMVLEYGKFNNIAILGAGNCNDTDLEYITRTFKNVTLFDIDREAMDRGVKKYNISDTCNIKLVSDFDFTGLERLNFYNELEEKLKNKDAIRSISKFIRKKADFIENDEFMERYKNEFDLVISMPVYSQLCIPSCGDMLNKYKDNYNSNQMLEIVEEIKYLNKRCVELYNNIIFEIAASNARFFILADMLEFNKFNVSLKSHILKLIANNDILKIRDTIELDHPVSGSNEGLYDLVTNHKKSDFVNYWIWPFSDTKEYLICALRLSKN